MLLILSLFLIFKIHSKPYKAIAFQAKIDRKDLILPEYFADSTSSKQDCTTQHIIQTIHLCAYFL